MVAKDWKKILYIAAIVFLAVDFILLLVYCLRRAWKKYQKKQEERREDESKTCLLISEDPFRQTPVKEIDYTPDIFEIPGRTISVRGNERNLRVKSISASRKAKQKNKKDGGFIDIDVYDKVNTTRKLSSIPRLCFELYYNFRTSHMQVRLICGKYLPDYANEQIIISVLMSHCYTIFHTERFQGPNPSFNEEVKFPLDSMDISSDPPILLKFNVWTIDKQSRRTAFGFVEVSIEEIMTQQGVTPVTGEGEVWRNIIRSDTLTDESQQGEVLISLTYLPGAQRLSMILVKAKDITISTADREIQGKVTLLYRDVEQKLFYSEALENSANPEFNQEFVFNFSDYKSVTIDGMAISVELFCKQQKIFMKPRMLGKFYIGHSGLADRFGKEHWASMLSTRTSVTKWHTLKPLETE